MADERAPAGGITRPFATTRWSLVAQSGPGGAKDALAELGLRYWYPVYAYVRRCGHAPPAAQALTRGFIAHLIEAGVDARPEARFRTWLLGALHRWLASDAPQAAGTAMLAPPLGVAELEARSANEIGASTPDRAFEHGFALELVAESLRRLRNEAARAGRLDLYDALQPLLSRAPAAGEIDALASSLSMRAVAVAVALERLRDRFREIVDLQLVETVGDAHALEAERAALGRALAQGVACE